MWSDSLTKDFLTIYAEGLAYNNFDKRTFYNVRRYTKDTCFVFKKSAGEVGALNSTNQLIFDRACLISISRDGYMSFSGGGVQRYLMPS